MVDNMKQNVGVLLPVSALPGKHGIGDFSRCAYAFVDWLKISNYHYWQILPLNPLGPGDSPYVSVCSEAIDIRYIDLDYLVKIKLLDSVPTYKPNSQSIDYNGVQRFKEKYLKKAFSRLKNKPYGYQKFKNENPWVERYSRFLILQKLNKFKPWNEWTIFEINNKQNIEFNFHIWCQFIAAKLWKKIFNFANKNNVQIIADCPFYVGFDSVDCYFNKEVFELDENNYPSLVSGCPPDAFSDTGQLWGTPVYNFEKMKNNNYDFLINRIYFLANKCNILRLDHFRAFDTYCVIPASDKNALRGQWLVGPREHFFDRLFSLYPNIKLIAEDLGILFESVHELRDAYHLPGMRVIQFNIFDAEPSNQHFVLYPGTHDNQTLFGWLKSLDEQTINRLKEKLNFPNDLYSALFDFIWNANSFITIFLLQDLLKLDNRARINTPGTVGKPNWCFKLRDMSWQKKIKYGYNKI